jgi:hypothetical protein
VIRTVETRTTESHRNATASWQTDSNLSQKETLATVAAASLALIMIFLACGRIFVVPLH